MIPAGLHVRKEMVHGIGPWVWVEADFWGWKQPGQEFEGLRNAILPASLEHRCIIQAGGCCGMYPRLWAEHFEHVYTFEPDPLNFYCLSANCASERITKIQAALSDAPGLCSVQKGPAFNVGMHRIGSDPGRVPILRLDDFDFRDIDVIQLDCEGHEGKIIDGARQTIERNRPVIAIEAPNDDLHATLRSLGYVERARCGANPDVIFMHENTMARAA